MADKFAENNTDLWDRFVQLRDAQDVPAERVLHMKDLGDEAGILKCCYTLATRKHLCTLALGNPDAGAE